MGLTFWDPSTPPKSDPQGGLGSEASTLESFESIKEGVFGAEEGKVVVGAGVGAGVEGRDSSPFEPSS